MPRPAARLLPVLIANLIINIQVYRSTVSWRQIIILFQRVIVIYNLCQPADNLGPRASQASRVPPFHTRLCVEGCFVHMG